MRLAILTLIAVIVVLLASQTAEQQAIAHHPFHSWAAHLTDYHDSGADASWGGSYCCGSADTQINQFLEEAGGWQTVSSVDYYQVSYSNADIQIRFATDTEMDSVCPGAAGCLSFGNFTCPSYGCAPQLYHDTKVQLYVRNSYWIGATETGRKHVLNHEIGHTFGLAEHYVDSYARGHVADASVYSGVMDNEIELGRPSANEIFAAQAIRSWY